MKSTFHFGRRLRWGYQRIDRKGFMPAGFDLVTNASTNRDDSDSPRAIGWAYWILHLYFVSLLFQVRTPLYDAVRPVVVGVGQFLAVVSALVGFLLVCVVLS